MEKITNKKLMEIVNKVNEMIPEDWSELYINGNINDKEGSVFFYYKPKIGKKKWIYSNDLERLFSDYSSEIFLENYLQLFDLFVSLQSLFKESNQEIWSKVIIFVNEDMKFSSEFDYADWYNSEYVSYEYLDFFEHNYLKLPLQDISKEYFEEMKAFKERENSKQK